MWFNFVADASLYAALERFDAEIAEGVRSDGCGCGGVLHSARYPRKPRGAEVSDEYGTRHSFCCAVEGCRRRRTPPSLRYLGRKVYLGVVVLLVTAMRHGVTSRRAAELQRAVGVSRRTLERWRTWWRDALPATGFWKTEKGRLPPSIATAELPASLLAVFVVRSDMACVVRVLDFVKLVTTSAIGPWQSISMVD